MNTSPTHAYRAAAARGASPVHLVVLLYEQLIDDLQRAVVAIEKNDIEGRTQEIDHALAVAGQLQGTLNMEAGGEVARNLELFYNLLRSNLLEAQIKVSPEILRRRIGNLVTLREAWTEVERAEAGEKSPPATVSANTGTAASRPDTRVDWKA